MTTIFLSLFCLLAFATSAAAECAWIRWAEVTTLDARPIEWKIMEVHTGRDACERELTAKRLEKYQQTVWWYKCIPDTIDPRGPKGR